LTFTTLATETFLSTTFAAMAQKSTYSIVHMAKEEYTIAGVTRLSPSHAHAVSIVVY